ncbi:helix-turn-helix domain-containing protein [Viscerimonas tarda]
MNNSWYDNFLDSLYERYPHKAQLTGALMDLLTIEREAVYRRLRKDVMFHFHEAIKIAKAWNISIDAITDVDTGYVHPFRLHTLKYINPSKEDIEAMSAFVDWLNRFVSFPDSEYMEVSNTLPRSLFIGFPQLMRYYIFKWMYQYGTESDIYPFARVIPSEEIHQIGISYGNSHKNMADVGYIWDPLIFNYLVNDINYFTSIYLITEEDKELLKKELLAFLDYLSDVSSRGCFPETGNRVNIYISQINIDTNYSYFYSKDTRISRIRTFIKHEMYSTDTGMTENIKKWLNLKKRASIQISGVDEPKRIEFFIKQRQLISEL